MGNALISRRGGGYAKIKFENYNTDTILTRMSPPPTQMSAGRYNLAATTVGNYALFAGGNDSALIDTYDSNLTHSTSISLSQARKFLAGATIGNYALFAGGSYPANTSLTTVDAYNTSLTRSTPTPLSVARSSLAGTTVGNYALFAGGLLYGFDPNSTKYSTVDAYNTSLTRSTPTPLSVARGTENSATTVGNYALFGSGVNYGGKIDAYNSSLTLVSTLTLSTDRTGYSATTVGNYALFGGGTIANGYLSVVEGYDSSLTQIFPTSLSIARAHLCATSVGGYAIFAGGNGVDNDSSAIFSIVDTYDTSLIRGLATPLSNSRYLAKGTSVGDYAIISGGHTGSISNTVDVYLKGAEFFVYPESRYKFQNMEFEGVSTSYKTIQFPVPATGYIKFKNTTMQ